MTFENAHFVLSIVYEKIPKIFMKSSENLVFCKPDAISVQWPAVSEQLTVVYDTCCVFTTEF